jgi:hypothetical protein
MLFSLAIFIVSFMILLLNYLLSQNLIYLLAIKLTNSPIAFPELIYVGILFLEKNSFQ